MKRAEEGGRVVRETGSACPQCADGGGRITSREPVYARISTRYRCDRGHEWEEPFQPSKPGGKRG